MTINRLVEKGEAVATPALVGIVPRKNLWETIQEQQWYHIPVKSAPRLVPNIEYLAFYFPAVFGEKLKYRVTYYAKVTAVETAKRIQLFPRETSHPRRFEDYYQIYVDKIMPLARAIPSKRWRRIVHIPTSLERLMNAGEINDLYDTSPLEDKMYRALTQQAINPERQLYVYLGRQTYCLDFCIYCTKANIDLECDGERYHSLPEAFTKDRLRNNELASFGWQILRFSGSDINRRLSYCLALVERTIRNLGGLKLEVSGVLS